MSSARLGHFDNVIKQEPLSIDDYTKQIIAEYQDQYNEIELAKLLGIGRKALWMRRNRWDLHRGQHDDLAELAS